MGYSSWSDEAYRSVSSGRAGASSAEIFRGTRAVDPLMDPKGVVAREARDSEHHPHSVPIVVGFDVTGSMGDIPTRFAQELLGHLMKRLVENGWVTDPQVLIAAIGDAVSDSAPLQIGQFESGLEMDMWLTRLWLEGRGGDWPESYALAHWFAARHTATDAWEKRRKKGYVFTVGDAPDKDLDGSQIERVFGAKPEGAVSSRLAVQAAKERWECFHVYVTRGNVPSASVLDPWEKLLGRQVLTLANTEAICELIGVVMGLREGKLDAAKARGLLQGAGMSGFDIDRALAAI